MHQLYSTEGYLLTQK